MRTRVLSLLLLAVAVVSLGACGAGDPNSVTMTSGHRFDPDTLNVTVGTEVTWTNRTAEGHTVTAYEDDLPEGADYFASGGATSESAARDDLADGLIAEGESFSVTFDRPGTYRYFCIPHESSGMKGTIVVVEG